MCVAHLFCVPPPTAVLSTLPLHDALPIWVGAAVAVERADDPGVLPGRDAGGDRAAEVGREAGGGARVAVDEDFVAGRGGGGERKSTRLNSSHRCISYAVFCLKKKKTGTLSAAAITAASPTTLSVGLPVRNRAAARSGSRVGSRTTTVRLRLTTATRASTHGVA